MAPPFYNQRGGGRNRGRGGARGGGPKLPGTLKDELGMPSHRGKSRGSAPFKSRPPRDRDDLDEERPPRQNFKSGTTRRIPLPPSAIAVAPLAAPTPTTAPVLSKRQAEDSELVASSSSSKKRKISAETSTPLSRLLSSTEAPAAASFSAKGKAKASAFETKETVVDLSIMSLRRNTRQEEEEDEEIRWLEWKLGKKGKGKAKAKQTGSGGGEDGNVGDEEDDGLDDLLDFADSVFMGTAGGVKGDEEDEDEDEEDEHDEDEAATQDDDEEDDDMDALSEDEEHEGNLEDFYTTSEDDGPPGPSTHIVPPAANPSTTSTKKAKSKFDRPSVRFRSPSPESSSVATGLGELSGLTPQAERVAKEDVGYVEVAKEEGREGDRGTEVAKGAPGVKSEEQRKLERKVQGLLNKLSESNIDGILGELEGVYRNNSRNSVTTTLTTLILATISSRSNLSDSFIILYAAFAASVYKIVGREFGGHLVQELMDLYLSLTSPASDEKEDVKKLQEELIGERSKQPLNLLVLIAELYNLHVISCRLIYDLIRGFIEGLALDSDAASASEAQEAKVEGLLKLLRCSGAQLRTDDPASLRDIVALVQQKTAGLEESMSVRTKFMVETLVNVRNNKMRAVPGGEVGAEARIKMKKFLGGLEKKRHIMVHEPLRVSLTDLQSARTTGKWWLVGAAWSGDPLAERAAEKARERELEGKKARRAEEEMDELDGLGVQDGDVLMKLARKQGMNTDVRRGVFVVIMSSDDYQHACDRLAGMKYTETQQREFVRVILHCLGVEPAYNPYYALLLTNLCTDSYSHRFTLQYALWDFLRELGETDVGGAATHSGAAAKRFDTDSSKVSRTRVGNVAKAVAWGVARFGLDLTVFKPVDFSSLQSKTKQFFRTFFAHLFLASQTTSPTFRLPKSLKPDDEAVELLFAKTMSITGLAQGISYFLTTEMGAGTLEAKGKLDLTDKQMQLVVWGTGVAKQVVLAAL